MPALGPVLALGKVSTCSRPHERSMDDGECARFRVRLSHLGKDSPEGTSTLIYSCC